MSRPKASLATPRPLEVLVAHHALGWSVCDLDHSNRHEAHNCESQVQYRAAGPVSRPRWIIEVEGRRKRLIPYLRSWSGLGLVVEAMRSKGWRLIRCKERIDFRWFVTFQNDREGRVATSGAHLMPIQDELATDHAWTAAFVAALRALGVDEETIQRAVEVGDE